ncbi:MAG: peptidase lon domain protein [Solirubrobacterales bacterium]|jgi:Lon protease-like protein|nr:peptidase lon domain protein [Solirubrobacterales bacterium]
MPDRVVQDFPLFPLGLVALPHEYVPLHIFEERYRTMIGECLDRGTEFGIVWVGEEGGQDVGCAMEIARILERMEDGRLNILSRGTRPFRVIETIDTLPYPAATVEFLEDSDEDVDDDTVQLAHDAYRQLVQQATDSEPDTDELEIMGAYAMAATVEFGLQAKQGLLDLRSENARLRLVARLFRAAAKRLEFIEKAQVRARSNGKVRFG